MENPTPFSLNETIVRWRAEFGSASSLNALEVEELEAHLRDHVAQLETRGMKPEAAFNVAVRQLGDRQRVAGEFAKINPQRIWVERAIWMAVGVFLFSVFSRLGLVASNILFSHSVAAGWDSALCAVLARFGDLASVALMTALLWFVFSRRLNWGRALVGLCERSLLATGAAVGLILWGCTRLSYFYDYLLSQYAPRLHAWVFPRIQVPFPDEAVINRISFICGIATDVIWAAALCVLAVRVVRGRRLLLLTTGTPAVTANGCWPERFMWMVAGWLLVLFCLRNLYGLALLPVQLLLPALGASTLVQHLAGLATATLGLLLWATPFWACWLFDGRLSWLGEKMRRAFRTHAIWTSVGIVLFLNLEYVLWPMFRWAGIYQHLTGIGPHQILSEWHHGYWTVICRHVMLAVLLVTLLRWRVKQREAR